jgi:Zn-dependent peptidase ImmA (M78 family)
MLSERLVQARLAAGLKPRDVLARLEEAGYPVTKQALSNYEMGKRVPKPGIMGALARALGVAPAQLLSEPEATVRWVAYRRQTGLSKQRRQEVEAKAERIVERYHYVRSRLYPKEKANLPRCNARTPADAEKTAEQVRRVWKLGEDPIESLARVVENQGGIVVDLPFEEVKFDGLSGWVNESFPVAVVNRSLPDDRRRFDLAHEIGHLTLDCPGASEDEREKLAYRFAGALLVPASAARKELGERRRHILPDELAALKRKYGLSMQAWLRRAMDLDIIDEPYYKSLCRVFSARGWRKLEPVEYRGNEDPIRLHQMALRALAEGMITEQKARELDPSLLLTESLESKGVKAVMPSRRELLRMPREERLRALARVAAAAEAEAAYAEDAESAEWADVGTEDLQDE